MGLNEFYSASNTIKARPLILLVNIPIIMGHLSSPTGLKPPFSRYYYFYWFLTYLWCFWSNLKKWGNLNLPPFLGIFLFIDKRTSSFLKKYFCFYVLQLKISCGFFLCEGLIFKRAFCIQITLSDSIWGMWEMAYRWFCWRFRDFFSFLISFSSYILLYLSSFFMSIENMHDSLCQSILMGGWWYPLPLSLSYNFSMTHKGYTLYRRTVLVQRFAMSYGIEEHILLLFYEEKTALIIGPEKICYTFDLLCWSIPAILAQLQ